MHDTHIPKSPTKPIQYYARNSDKTDCKTNGQIAGIGRKEKAAGTLKETRPRNKTTKKSKIKARWVGTLFWDGTWWRLFVESKSKQETREGVVWSWFVAAFDMEQGDGINDFRSKFEGSPDVISPRSLNGNLSPDVTEYAEANSLVNDASMEKIFAQENWMISLFQGKTQLAFSLLLSFLLFSFFLAQPPTSALSISWFFFSPKLPAVHYPL